MVDAVLTVITLPIGDARPGHGGSEARGLRHRPHGHVAAVTPAGDAEPVRVHGRRLQDGIDSGQDVAQVAVAEVFDVRAGECFAVAKAAAGVGEEDEVASLGKHRQIEEGAGPSGVSRRSRATVDGHDEWIALVGVVVARVEQPTLHVPIVALPVQALYLAPSNFGVPVGMTDLLPGANRTSPDFGRVVEGMADHCGRIAVPGQGYGRRPATG